MIKLEIDQLHTIASEIKKEEDSYLKTYLIFINYFKEQDQLTDKNIIIGISLVYSWMPTILKNLDLEKIEEATKILNKAKTSEQITKQELELLISTFNNSLVGSSKLLHFINPKKYAIWDSKVFKALYNNKTPYQGAITNPDKYFKYLKWIEGIIKQPSFNQLYEKIKSLIGNNITEYRAIEYCLFKKPL
jgi:hypothetical protein